MNETTHQSIDPLCVLPLLYSQVRHAVCPLQGGKSRQVILLFCHRNEVALFGIPCKSMRMRKLGGACDEADSLTVLQKGISDQERHCSRGYERH
jgi:hypothetical protein